MSIDYVFNYTAVIVAAGFGFGGIGFTFILSRLLAPSRPSLIKSIAYECGIIPTGKGNTKYNIRYYLFALFFLIFAVEVVFMFPWVVAFLALPVSAFVSMMIFLAILIFGLLYAWRKGVLQWR
ncbi:MAG: NADH-quinone oxidoreductase subunit A [Dehalococcoidia bacterium]